MTKKNDIILPTTEVLYRITLPIMLMMLLLLLSWFDPVINNLQAPYSELDSSFTELALWFSDSGHFPFVVLVGLTFLLLLISRHGLSGRTRIYMVLCAVFISIVLAGCGAWLNENIVKETFKYPRPNIQYLAGEGGNGPLGMTAREFYQGPDKDKRTKLQRSKILQQVLNQQMVPVTLSADVQEHWINETGYSFPSGHSFASLFFASFFLALGLSYLSGWKKYVFYLLLPWALVVCYSRLVLRVHTPLDITVGALEGLLLGIIGFLLFRFIMKNLD